MSALMKVQSIFVFTHDSIGLGEDGPTHQPVEQLTALRSTPNMRTWRPCDAVESAVAWKAAIERRDGPSSLVFSRQNLPHQSREPEQLADIARGGYVLRDCSGAPDAIIIATGSEVELAMVAADKLAAAGKQMRVVSMPCTELFDQQDASYREAVLPSDVLARVAVEALHADFWYKYVGLDGRVVGMTTFGESAPAADLMQHFGFTVDNVVAVVEDVLS
jgi:transketolase